VKLIAIVSFGKTYYLLEYIYLAAASSPLCCSRIGSGAVERPGLRQDLLGRDLPGLRWLFVLEPRLNP